MRTFSKLVKKTHEKSPEVATGGVLWKKTFRPTTLFKRDSVTGFFLLIMRNF